MKTPYELSIYAVTASLLISFIINKYLLKYGAFKHQSKENIGKRWAEVGKPTVGGFTLYVVFLLNLYFVEDSLKYLLFPLSIAFVLGLVDDYFNLAALFKFVGQAMVACLLINHGDSIHILESNFFNVTFTFFWIIGLMNAINMLDNMDGILASTVLIILLIALIIRPEESSFELNLHIVCIMGALISFLYFNWQPAKMYMGDSGSQFLGAFLAWISIQYFWNFREAGVEGFQGKQFLVPILSFIVPLIDTSTVIFFRMQQGISPFVGGKDHLAHHLVYAGFSEKKAVKILSIVSILSGLIVFFIADAVGTNMWISTNTYLLIAYWLIVWVILQVLYDKGMKP
jgi:UDP-GlcNAc:undecaprenyl-phosphate/decaprenyl-phosphate GlcNAc-1-phosphate transferase